MLQFAQWCQWWPRKVVCRLRSARNICDCHREKRLYAEIVNWKKRARCLWHLVSQAVWARLCRERTRESGYWWWSVLAARTTRTRGQRTGSCQALWSDNHGRSRKHCCVPLVFTFLHINLFTVNWGDYLLDFLEINIYFFNE